MTTGSRARVKVDGRVATITLARPQATSDLEATAFELRDAIQRVDQDEGVWAVVLTGGFFEGAAFADEQEVVAPPPRMAAAIASIAKPVVAAIGGDALDQGLELALACDIRIAANSAQLGLTQVARGVIPSDGGTQRLPRLIGASRAMEMILRSRVLDSREAVEMGLVSQTVEPDRVLEEAQSLATSIAGHGPIAARYVKEAVLKGRDMTLEQGLRLEADLSFILQSTADRAEGIRSFLERRRPEYRGE